MSTNVPYQSAPWQPGHYNQNSGSAPPPPLYQAPYSTSSTTQPAAALPFKPSKGPVVTHACLTLNMSDRLRLVRFSPTIIDAIRQTIMQSWGRGIQNERVYAGAHEFKLYGNPWYGQGAEAVPSRVMMAAILSCLYHHGWILVISTDVSKKAMDKDTLIFKQGPIPSPCAFFSISMNEGDKLRLINAPNVAINAVKQVLGKTIQREDWKVVNVAYQFKMFGYPWFASGDEAVTTRVLLLAMLDALTGLGYELHASIDMSTGPGSGSSAGSDTDTWFLRKVNG